jgi:hypothetical protein
VHGTARASLWAARRCAPICVVWLLGLSCTEPSFVSLGGNVKRAALATDAGVRDSSTATDTLDAAEVVPLPGCGDEALRVPVTSDCSARGSVECPLLETPQYGVDELLSILLRECRALDNLLEVRFGDSGCAVGFGLDANASSTTSDVAACVANRLATERFACAEGLACGRGNSFQVPAR